MLAQPLHQPPHILVFRLPFYELRQPVVDAFGPALQRVGSNIVSSLQANPVTYQSFELLRKPAPAR